MAYKRYAFTESGVSPRAVPGVPHHTHTAATDEHDEDGTLISDEFTDPTKPAKHDGQAPAESARDRGRGPTAPNWSGSREPT